jgi:hypothetical protein
MVFDIYHVIHVHVIPLKKTKNNFLIKRIWKCSTLRFCPSNGNDPLTRVYKITPKLHTSTSGPSYFFPWNNSGAAYGGLPQNVSNLFPGVNSLLKPKSAIFIFNSESSNKFSA